MNKKKLLFFTSILMLSISLVSGIGIWRNRQLYFEEHIVSMTNIRTTLEYYCYDWRRMAEGLMPAEEYEGFVIQSPETFYYVTNNETGEVFSNLPEGSDLKTFSGKPGIVRYVYQNPPDEYWERMQEKAAENQSSSIAEAFREEIVESGSREEKYTGSILVDMEIIENKHPLGSIGNTIKMYDKQRQILLGESILFVITLTGGILLFVLGGRKALTEKPEWIDRIKLDVQIWGITIATAAIFFLLPGYIRRVVSYVLLKQRLFDYGFLVLAVFTMASLVILLAVRAHYYRRDKQLWLQNWEKRLTRSFPIGVTAFVLLLCWYGFIIMSYRNIILQNYYMGNGINLGLILLHIGIILLFSLILQKISNIRQQYQQEIIGGANKIADGHPETEIPVAGSGYPARTAEAINRIRTGYIRSLEEQKKSERLKYELVTNISHDLRTPLTLVLNYIGLLKRRELSGEDRHYISQAENQAQKIHLLVEDLFELSGLESGNIAMKVEDTDILLLWKQMQQECLDQLAKRKLELIIECSTDKLILPCDSAKIWRVFDNLLQNAMKYSLENTRIYVCLLETKAGDEIQVQVKNITPERITFAPEELFLRFKRGNEARDTEGSGLGLAIAKSIVMLHGGSIRIETEGDMFKVLMSFVK